MASDIPEHRDTPDRRFDDSAYDDSYDEPGYREPAYHDTGATLTALAAAVLLNVGIIGLFMLITWFAYASR